MALEHQKQGTRALELPTLIFGSVEIHRLLRELEALDEYVTQANIRAGGKQAPLPKTSRLLDAVAGNNNFNLLIAGERARLATFLKNIDAKAPAVRISFATDPSSAFTVKLVAWFRTNIHPYTLVNVGLQPNIAAGCIVRTSNKLFDFSLRDRLHGQRALLLRSLEGGAQ